MPYKDLEKRKIYHREYYKEYMKDQGAIYRDSAETKRKADVKDWKSDLLLDYKLRRVQKKYGREGLIAFERDMFMCTICGEYDFRVLEMHELCKPFNTASNLRTLCSNCHARITFHSGSQDKGVLNSLLDSDYYDAHFMRITQYYGNYANCYSRKYGAVIVNRDEYNIPYIVSMGRNGPPIGFPHCNERNPNHEEVCPRKLNPDYKSGANLDFCPAAHAERNAIMFAAREGRSGVDKSTLYGNFNLPCKDCAIAIIQAGIKEVVLIGDSEYSDTGVQTKRLFDLTEVKFRVINEESIKEKAFQIK